MPTQIATRAGELVVSEVYAGLTQEDGAWLSAQEVEIGLLMATAAECWVKVGLILIEVRARLPEGLFKAWIMLRSGMTRPTVYRRIEHAEVFGDLYVSVSHETTCANSLSHGETRPLQNIEPTAMNMLLDAPRQVQDQAKQLAVQGGKITPDAVRQMVKLHKESTVSTEPGIGGRADMIPRRIAEATLPGSKVVRFSIHGDVIEDPEGDKMIQLTEEVHESGDTITSKDRARTVPEALENVAEEIDGYDPSEPAIDPEPHREWAQAVGAGVASEYELKGVEIDDLKAVAVKELVTRCRKFDPAAAPSAACKEHGTLACSECQMRGYAHLAIQKECRRAAEQLRNGGTYRTRRQKGCLVVGQLEDE